MAKLDGIPDQQYVFGSLLMLANRIDTMLARELRPFDVTTKQWFLSVMIASLFEQPPTVMEVAKMMGSSHQNVKQVALKLAEKNLLRLEKDPADARITRLVMTEYSQEFWKQTDEAGNDFMRKLFSGLSDKKMGRLKAAIGRMLGNIELMDENG